MALPPRELFVEIWRRHGHRCPMSTLGGRLGWAARWRLSAGMPVTQLHAIYRIDTCAVEGIRCATGCSESDGSLEVRPQGEHRLTLVERTRGRGMEAALRPETLALAGEYRQMDDALERERAGLGPEELARRQHEKETFLDDLLERLCNLPDAELLELRPVTISPAAEM